MNPIWPSIQLRACATFAYTAGIGLLQPKPHATIPFCAYRLSSKRPIGHTSGAPKQYVIHLRFSKKFI